MKFFPLVLILICVVCGCNRGDGDSVPGPFTGITTLSQGDVVIEGLLDESSALPAPLYAPQKSGTSGLVGKEILLVDSDGGFLARRTVNQNDIQADGSCYYIFQGAFVNKTVKLRVPYSGKDYDILLGQVPNIAAEDTSSKFIKLDTINIPKEVISTRICEERGKVEPGYDIFDIRDRENIRTISNEVIGTLGKPEDFIFDRLDKIRVDSGNPDKIFIHEGAGTREVFVGDNSSTPELYEIAQMNQFSKYVKEVYAGGGTSELSVVYSAGSNPPVQVRAWNPLYLKIVYQSNIIPSSYVNFSGVVWYDNGATFIKLESGTDITTTYIRSENALMLTITKPLRPETRGKLILINGGAGTKMLPDGTTVSNYYYPVVPIDVF